MDDKTEIFFNLILFQNQIFKISKEQLIKKLNSPQPLKIPSIFFFLLSREILPTILKEQNI